MGQHHIHVHGFSRPPAARRTARQNRTRWLCCTSAPTRPIRARQTRCSPERAEASPAPRPPTSTCTPTSSPCWPACSSPVGGGQSAKRAARYPVSSGPGIPPCDGCRRGRPAGVPAADRLDRAGESDDAPRPCRCGSSCAHPMQRAVTRCNRNGRHIVAPDATRTENRCHRGVSGSGVAGVAVGADPQALTAKASHPAGNVASAATPPTWAVVA